MATYVLMTKLTPAALQGTSGRRATGHDWKKKVEAVFTDALKKHLAEKGFDPLMGARPMS